VASWLQQLGWDAWVLEGGARSGLKGPDAARANLPAVVTISADELKRALDLGECAVFDLGTSMDYRKAHIPGSRWSTRTRLAADARDEKRTIVLAGESDVARLAATELMDSGARDVKLLAGGRADWIQAGYSTEASPAIPADAECIDYLFFVHDRHAGNPEAMRQYLAWETGLLGQLDGQDRAAFRIPAA